MKFGIALVISIAATWSVGCTSDRPTALPPSPATATPPATAKPSAESAAAPTSETQEVNSGTFAELEKLNDQFVARIATVTDVRNELMDRRSMGSSDLAQRGQEVCATLNQPSVVESGSEVALDVAGDMLELSAYIPDKPMDKFVKDVFVRTAANVYCPDNAAGVR